MTPAGKLIFVDLETTGANHLHDRITEIGIVEVEGEEVRRWSTLVNPGVTIPPFIQNLTGISNEMVADAPAFASLLATLLPKLSDGLFIAHNARFDYGFLRSAFRAAGLSWRLPTLCTVKLSRQLFPQEAKHNLDALVARHALVAEARHRALADADLVRQLWEKLQAAVTPETFDGAVRQLLQRPSLPPHLDADAVDELPNTPGVYIFYGENDYPLYVGKSVHLRARVLSHFNADQREVKEMRMAQQIRRLDCFPTAGELGALLLEARLVKQHKPLHNRRLRAQRELCSWQLVSAPDGSLQPRLVFACDEDFGSAAELHGLYGSRMKAEETLRTLAQTQQLCLVALGLEKSAAPGKPCFARQLHRCAGACTGSETNEAHAARVRAALASHKLQAWPYAGAIALVENGTAGRQEWHVIHNWTCIGSVPSEAEALALLRALPARPPFDHDSYKILLRHVLRGEFEIRPLSP